MIVPSRHLARSRTKKNICSYTTKDLEYIKTQTADFARADDFDAYCVFEYRVICAIREYGMFSEEARLMESMAVFHFNRINAELFAAEKESLSLVTSIDMRNYGESLCEAFLRE